MKTILITGAATGLGKGTAIGLAQAGHKVIATVENWPQVTQLRADTDAAGVDLVVEKLDYLQPDDHDTVLRKYGEEVDIAVLNAATGQTGPVAEVPVDRIREVFEVNVFNTLELAQRFAAIFVKRGNGKIVFKNGRPTYARTFIGTEKETGVEQSVTIQGASNLNESEIQDMLEEAEKYASVDKEKRENIDLKNQAEALCFEAEKELALVKDSLSEEKQQNATKLIEQIRQDSQSDNFEALKSQLEELKTIMKEMLESKMNTRTGKKEAKKRTKILKDFLSDLKKEI